MENDRISKCQKGFMPVDGCSEHNFMLQSIITETKRRRRRCCIGWLDLSNAFGSVPHDAIFEALAWVGLDENAIGVVRHLYDDCSTRIRTGNGFTPDIPVLSGVKQGCPLSPIIFNLAMEPLLRSITTIGGGFEIGEDHVTALAYADDLVLVDADPDGLQRFLNAASHSATQLGLKFNPSKCATLDLNGHMKRANDTVFSVQDGQMPVLSSDDFYHHLGVPTGRHTTPSPERAIEQIAVNLEAIDTSLLAPWQKIDAVNTFLTPTLLFHLRNGVTAKGPLTELDKRIKAAAKRWLNLPQRASAEVVYIPYRQGGAGIIPLNILADVSQVVHGYRLLRSSNLDRFSSGRLSRIVTERLRRPLEATDVARYLNGDMTGDFATGTTSLGDVWTRLRTATTRLRTSIPLEWTENRDHVMELRLGDASLQPATTERLLRNAVQEFHRQKLLRKPDQGKVFEVTSASSSSNHFLANGSFTRFADWRFVHRARLGVVPLNGARRFGQGDKRCRRCGHPNETLPHVLCHCRPHMQAITRRHDAILQRLIKAVRLPANVQIRVNQQVPGCDSTLRPDLVLIDDDRRTTTIVDVATPFENRYASFQEARRLKEEKYEGIATSLRDSGYRVTVDAFIVGALGGWDHANEVVLRRLCIGQYYAKLMRKLMASDCIRWSRDIYVEHTTGHRQFE